MASSESSRPVSDSIDFIDIVFTAMVTIGLTPEVLQVPHVTGMLSEQWVQAALRGDPAVPSDIEWLHLATFILALLTLLLSWFGVHASLQLKPIRYNSGWGMARFILDVALVLLYGAILVFFRQLQAVLLLLALVYFLYVVWDVFKLIEYRDKYREEYRHYRRSRGSIDAVFMTFHRQLVSLLFAVFFAALWLGDHISVWTVLLLAIVFTVLYRVLKIYLVVLVTWLRKTICAVIP